jgi:hypothetical protein
LICYKGAFPLDANTINQLVKMLEDTYGNVQSAARNAIIKLVEDGKSTFPASDTEH